MRGTSKPKVWLTYALTVLLPRLTGMTDAAGSDLDRVRHFLVRLETLVLRLLRAKFQGPKSVWQLQLDLLSLQRDIQAAIRERKSIRRGSDAQTNELDALRWALWHSRRFGDALAWSVIGGDRRFIYPLAHNQPAPVLAKGPTSDGLVAVAVEMANRGLGFPLIHDVTHLLRVGDLSLVAPGEAPRLVEVKTKVRGRSRTSGGKEQVEYQVSAVWAEGLGAAPAPDHDASDAPRPDSAVIPWSARLRRQLGRMTKARIEALAEPNVPTEFEGQRILTAIREGEGRRSRWDVVRRVIRRAKRTGYASESVDQAFLYAAIFDPRGLRKNRLETSVSELPKDLVDSGIFFHERERNSLIVNTVPHPSRRPQLFLPYFLYSIPRTAVLDMLHGRLILLNLLNPGRVAEALENEGFSVEVASEQKNITKDPLTVSAQFSDDEGNLYRVEMHQLQLHLDEMVMEFLPLAYLTDVANAMKDAVRQAALHDARSQPSEVE